MPGPAEAGGGARWPLKGRQVRMVMTLRQPADRGMAPTDAGHDSGCSIVVLPLQDLHRTVGWLSEDSLREMSSGRV